MTEEPSEGGGGEHRKKHNLSVLHSVVESDTTVQQVKMTTYLNHLRYMTINAEDFLNDFTSVTSCKIPFHSSVLFHSNIK